MLKEIQIAGTWRESEITKRYWEKRKLSKEGAERIWKQKLWLKESPGEKGALECLNSLFGSL